jgi:hypothetical protein
MMPKKIKAAPIDKHALAKLKFAEAIQKAVMDYYEANDWENNGWIFNADVCERFRHYLEGQATFVLTNSDGRYEPPTCGTDHIVAERALSLIERSHGPLSEGLDYRAIEAISDLASRSGVYNARMALRTSRAAMMVDLIDEEPPF